MPRPCAVESHACRYKRGTPAFGDATALRRGVSRSLLQERLAGFGRCHGLAPWSLTLAATKEARRLLKMPRPCAVESHARCYKRCLPLLKMPRHNAVASGFRLRIADCEAGISDAGCGVLNRKHRSLFPRTALRLVLRIGKARGKLPILSPKSEIRNPNSDILTD
jgi:hypothetical protein